MSEPIVVMKTPRDSDMVEVVVSIDGQRFTVHVPKAVDESPDAVNVYRAMADSVARRRDETAAILEANRSV